MATSTTAKFSALILWLLFTTVIALRDSYEHNKQDVDTVIPNGLYVRTSANVDNPEFFDGVPTAAALSNKGIQGRKMLVNDVMRKENMVVMKAGVLMKDGTSLKSGDHQGMGLLPVKTKVPGFIAFSADAGEVDNDASKSVNGAPSSQSNMKNQNDNNKLMKAKKLNTASMKNAHTPAGSEPVDDGFINNLMHKDYNGNTGLKPRHKPPINNKYPMDDYHSTPRPHPPVPTTNEQTNDDYAPPRRHPPSSQPMTVDYSTPRPHPPNPTLNYEPFNADYPKGPKQRNPPINNHEPLDDDEDEANVKP